MNRRTRHTLVGFLLVVGIADASTRADERPGPHQGEAARAKRSVYRSGQFILRTDLSQADANDVLKRMEATLAFAAHYWRRETRGQIECFVVHDLKHWPDAALPHPLARVWIGGVGGATISQMVGAGRSARVKATVYACDEPGVVEHEVVHAYCFQAFGTSGPDWYKEGMAEFAVFGRDRVSGVRCPSELINVLRSEQRMPIRQIVDGDLFTRQISDSMTAMLASRADVNRHVALDVWTDKDAEGVRRAKRAYLWSWALCHMLQNNPNYRDRFRLLGRNLLQKKDDSLESAFEPVMDQLVFEYVFFLNHIGVGYRVDLCGWDWTKRFRASKEWRSPRTIVPAVRGYQASGLMVVEGERWKYRTEGKWVTSDGGPWVDTDGDPMGRGRLMGVVLNDYRLSRPFELGLSGEFEAPASGKLYLRCRDNWNQLGDNQGQVDVWLTCLSDTP
ncbi:MAG: hypothetical protein ACC628_14505 [Pirellulaceae bacterium]